MVRQLSKDGDQIITELDAMKAHRWHMASALLGEVSELFEADINDTENLIEEVGDCLFYLEGICYTFDDFDGFETLVASSGLEDPTRPIFNIGLATPVNHTARLISFTVLCGRIFDSIKREAIYNKPIFEDESKVREIKAQLITAYQVLDQFVFESVKFDLNYCRERNIEKLGERYDGFKYSNESAINRADKHADTENS